MYMSYQIAYYETIVLICNTCIMVCSANANFQLEKGNAVQEPHVTADIAALVCDLTSGVQQDQADCCEDRSNAL